MDLGIGNQSVVVLTTPRTGSSALCDRLTIDLNLINHSEAFHPDYGRPIAFWRDFKDGVRLICKIFPKHTITNEELDILCRDSFVIFLERDDVIEQIASYHCMAITNKTVFFKHEPETPYIVSLDNTKIAYSIRKVLELRRLAEAYRSRADITLKYEAIVDMIENDRIRKYDKPENYNELLTKIKKLMPIFAEEDRDQRLQA